MGVIKTQRVTLSAGTVTPITPPGPAHKVTIGNATADDVRLYGEPNDSTNYIVIAAGFERTLLGPGSGARIFAPNYVAFQLNSIAGGVVVLEWI